LDHENEHPVIMAVFVFVIRSAPARRFATPVEPAFSVQSP
jgi:hypothetical protein